MSTLSSLGFGGSASAAEEKSSVQTSALRMEAPFWNGTVRGERAFTILRAVMADAPSEIDVGTVVGGTYQVDKLIGRGGMGAVWGAAHMRLPGKQVAIKVL